MRRKGTIVIDVVSERDLGSAMAGCQGYLQYRELNSVNRGTPRVFDMIERAVGDNPEPGSTVRLTISVEVLKSAAKSKKTCHNPWPAHRCPSKRPRKS